MKAVAVYSKRRQVHLIDHPEPHLPGPNEVKLRILEVGICGTDRHICSFAFGTPPETDEYLILGHEALGEVVAVGSEVRTLKPGDLVVPEVRRPCSNPTCLPCQAGRQDFCTTMTYTERGIMGLHGYMTEFVVDEEAYLNYIPPHLRDVAVLIEPLTIAEKALIEVWQIQQRLPWRFPDSTPEQPGRGLRAVVLGAGPIGLLGAMALVNAGFTTTVYSRSPAPNPKATLTSAIGATYISSEEISVEQLVKEFGPIDLVYEAMDAAPTAIEVLEQLGPNGIYIFTSQPGPKTDLKGAFRYIIGRNKVILGTVNAGHDAFVTAIHDLDAFNQRWPQALRSLITARHSLEEASVLLQEKTTGIKHVISLHP